MVWESWLGTGEKAGRVQAKQTTRSSRTIEIGEIEIQRKANSTGELRTRLAFETWQALLGGSKEREKSQKIDFFREKLAISQKGCYIVSRVKQRALETKQRLVAQWTRARGYEPRCRGFKSLQACIKKAVSLWLTAFFFGKRSGCHAGNMPERLVWFLPAVY